MEPVIRDGLCGLCRCHGWSYGICWRFDQRDPRLLVMGDSYYDEEEIGTVIDKMITQVHFVGEGIVGVAAISGKHEWYYSDGNPMELSSTSFNDNVGMFKGTAEWQHQFLAGMKTIAIISLPSFGVVQFGSTHKIHENFEFISQARHLIRQLGGTKGYYVPEYPHKTTEIRYPSEGFASVISSRHSAPCESINSSHDVISQELQYSAGSLTSPILSSTQFSLQSQTSPGSQICSRYLNQFQELPAINCISSFMNQCLEPQMLLHPNNNMQSAYSLSCDSYPANLNMNSHSSSTQVNLFQNSLGDSVSSNDRSAPSQSGKLLDSSSSSPAKSSSKSSSITSEIPDNFLSFLQDSCLEFQFKEDQMDQIHLCEQPSVKDNDASVRNETVSCNPPTDLPSRADENSFTTAVNSLPENDLFEGVELELSPRILLDCWDDIIMPIGTTNCLDLGTSVSDYNSDLFSGSNFEQLLEAIVEESANPSSSHTSIPSNVSAVGNVDLEHQISTVTKIECPQVPEINSEKIIQQSSDESLSKSHVSSWIEDSCTMNNQSVITNQPKKHDKTGKVVRKRASPGESTRPRPKDRQQIQDRVKELREIVPNSAKCSIDSLLDRTIKHMLFLQSVTKYADKLKQSDEPKMIGDASGVVLKEKSTGGDNGGGATWAYEVAGQTMVCPILVEDLNPPGQMLVEMLCEERGFFLEIADTIRGFGLTILKGVMEIRDSKIWAQFLVDANREVTRMDIFLSLVQLLQQTSSIRAKVGENEVRRTFIPIPVGVPDRLQ